MTMTARTRIVAAALLSVLLSVALVTPVQAHSRHHNAYPDLIDLPVGFQPEGITIGKAPYAYLGSLADGDIYRVDLRTGQGKVISEGPGTSSVGLKIDQRGLLWVSGGGSGSARVVSAKSGKVLASYQLSDKPSFINDVVLTKRAAWFTNSQQPELYAVSRGHGRHGKDIVRTVPLGGEWVQQPGFNANGIAQTPDGHALLVVQSVTSTLYRVDPKSGYATRVDLGGYAVTNGDGLLVKGHTLYVVQNRLNQIAVFDLNRRGTKGSLVKTLRSPAFDVPTTVALYRGSAYAPNARFGIESPATADFALVRVDR